MKQTHIITISYTADAEAVDQVRAEHRKFLDQGYKRGLFIASGPNSDKNGGVILASGDLDEIKTLLKEDPFALKPVATYSYQSFNPVKHALEYQAFI